MSKYLSAQHASVRDVSVDKAPLHISSIDTIQLIFYFYFYIQNMCKAPFFKFFFFFCHEFCFVDVKLFRKTFTFT